MESINFNEHESGHFNEKDTKFGFMYEGKFFEIGSLEYKNLMLMEGRKVSENSLLGICSRIETENIDNLIDKN